MLVDNPTKLGTVQNVTGASISVKLDTDTIAGLSFVDGQGYRIGQLGSFVRIPIGYVNLFGIVSQVGAGAVPEALADIEPYGYRWLTVQLVGESFNNGEFKRGLSQYPTIGDHVHLVTEKDLSRIYGRQDSPKYVRVGHLASAENIPALVDIDLLVTRHSAVVGATGSGKSTTVSSIINSLTNSDKFPSARILILDIHGEYTKALGDKASVFSINPSKHQQRLCIPYWALNFEELISITMGVVDDRQRGAILDKVMQLKQDYIAQKPCQGVDSNSLTVDSPVPFSLHKMWLDLYRMEIATYNTNEQKDEDEALELDGSGNPIQPGDALKVIAPKYLPHNPGGKFPNLSRRGVNLRRQLEGLASKIKDPRFNFLFNPGDWLPNEKNLPKKDLDVLLKDWIGSSKPVSILDLSGIPSEILTTLIGVLLRIIYDALFWSRDVSEGGRGRPILIVLEEAHTYLNKGNNTYGTLAVQRIVKEGRKYGIGAMIVSQRPSEIDTTILSQCGTIFAMRLNNSSDRAHVIGAVTDNLEGLLNMLPTLRTGEVIIIGEAVNLPVRTVIDLPPAHQRPDSEDPSVAEAWSQKGKFSDYKDVVALWRKQQPKTTHYKDNINRQEVVDRKEDEDMDRTAVSSSNLASVGYDPSTQTLEVEFNNGSIYQYYDVPESVYESLMSADSHGKFLNSQIKGYYRYARI